MYKAEILADSLSPQGHRLTTMKITFPRIVLAEFNTHRMFSRNSASSRAIPFNKMVQMVEENPFIPIAWQKDHKGMQGTEYLIPQKRIYGPVDTWLEARNEVVKLTKSLNKQEVTKQLCNRLLEPFMWHTVIVTATEWENFFELRCPKYHTPVSGESFYARSWKELQSWHSNPENEEKLEKHKDDILFKLQHNKSQADIHIQAIAELMWDEYQLSQPKQLQAGEWHIPFGDNIDIDQIRKIAMKESFNIVNPQLYIIEQDLKIKIATARCARISYETLGDNPKVDYEADIRLHDMLMESKHWSPFEHVARAMSNEEYDNNMVIENGVHYPGRCRNFTGFIQYRSMVDNGKD